MKHRRLRTFALIVAAGASGVLASCARHDTLFEGGEGAGAIAVDASSLAFDAAVGCSSEGEFTLRNIGDGPIEGSIPASLADGAFQIHGGGAFRLEPGQTRHVHVSFEPPATGSFEAHVRLPGAARTVHLTGEGVDPPTCVVTGTSLDFGTFTGGTSCPQRTFTIRNTGTGLLEGVVTSPCPDFLILSDPVYSLTTGQEVTITVQFAPTSTGAAECEIDVGAPCFCAAVSCDGSATATASGVVTSETGNTLAFGSVLADGAAGESRTLAFSVRNAGASSITVNPAFSQSAADFTILDAGSRSVAPGESTSYSVRFNPANTVASYRDWAIAITGLGGCALPVTARGEVRFTHHVFARLACCRSCHTTSYAWASSNSNPSNPAGSTLLRKATAQVSHAGSGTCLWTTGSVEYQTTLAWITQGVPGP